MKIWHEVWDYIKMIIIVVASSPGYQQCSTDQRKNPFSIHGENHYDRRPYLWIPSGIWYQSGSVWT